MMRKFKHNWSHYKHTLSGDVLAGATNAVAGAPQAMGFAIIAGINPIYGLYTAIVATIVGALAGSSTFLTIGPTNALALVIGSTLVSFDAASQVERLFTLTLLVGIFQLAFGLLRLGELSRFVSNAVMTGFITGAGVLIILGQLQHLTGYAITTGQGSLPRFWYWLGHLRQTDGPTLVIGILTMAIIIGLRNTRWRNIATLTALALTSSLVILAGWDNVLIVRDIALIPHDLPIPALPSLTTVPTLVVAALAIAVLASVQSAAISNNLADCEATPPNVNRDLAGQGLANIITSLFQGMAAGGSLSRTAINLSAGAHTRLANLLAGVFIAIGVITFGSLIEQVTLAALAGQLIVAAMTVIKLHQIKLAWRINFSARLSMVMTFIATLVLPLEYSIYIGVALSLGLYVYTSANTIKMTRLIPVSDYHYREADIPAHLPSYEPIVLSVSGNLYFAAVKRLQELMPSLEGTDHPVVILRLRDNHYLGSTGIRFLETYERQLRAQGGKLILTGVSSQIEAELTRTNAIKIFGPECVFRANGDVFDATTHAVAYATAWLAKTASR